MIQITLGAWNIRTLLDRKKANRPDRRTALIASELNRYNLPIVALSETRFAGESSLTERGAGYTFFWSGRKEEEKRESGVGFAIKSSLVNKLDKPPKGINDRLMSLRLPLADKKYATIFSVYAPTMTNPEEAKSNSMKSLQKPYQRSQALISSSSWVISMLVSVKITWPGLEFLEIKALESATLMAYSSLKPVRHMNSLSQTQSSSCQLGKRLLGCIQDLSTGTSLTMLSQGSETDRMFG